MSCSRLLSCRSLLGLNPDPGFPGEGPHSLLLQEGHLQALQVQEPPARMERPAVSRGVRRSHRRHQQGPLPLLLGQHQRWCSQSTQADREAPAPCLGSQESKSPSQGRPKAPETAEIDCASGPSLCPEPQEAPCPFLPKGPAAPRSPPSTGSWSCCPQTHCVRTRGTIWSLRTFRFRMEAKGA